MKLHTAPRPAPNPRRVHVFLAEAGLTDIEFEEVSLAQGEHKSEPFLARNPMGQIPVLELDDGTCISESVAICRYLEATKQSSSLFGQTPLEAAHIDQWNRRVESTLLSSIGMIWVHTHPITARLIKQNKDWGETNRALLKRQFAFWNDQLAERDFIAGAYSVADISAQCFLDFASDMLEIAIPETAPNVKAWHDRLTARPSAIAFA